MIREEGRGASPIEQLVSLVPEKERKKKTVLVSLEKAMKRHAPEYWEINILCVHEKAKTNYRAFLCKALGPERLLDGGKIQKK